MKGDKSNGLMLVGTSEKGRGFRERGGDGGGEVGNKFLKKFLIKINF